MGLKKIAFTLLGVFLVSSLAAKSLDASDFSQERMLLEDNGIYFISTLENGNSISLYSHGGDFLWKTQFSSEIVSWSVYGSQIIVLSQEINGYTTYLSCLDSSTGKIIWQH